MQQLCIDVAGQLLVNLYNLSVTIKDKALVGHL